MFWKQDKWHLPTMADFTSELWKHLMTYLCQTNKSLIRVKCLQIDWYLQIMWLDDILTGMFAKSTSRRDVFIGNSALIRLH